MEIRMKKIIYTLLLCVAALVLLTMCTACANEKEPCLDFVSNGDGTCYVSGIGTVTQADVVIPETSPEGDRVTGIGNYAFGRCAGITTVTVPEGVTYVGNYAFYYCSDLVGVTLPDTVQSIGHGAFYNCKSLTTLAIPSQVISVQEDTFYGCNFLTYVTIPNSVTSIDSNAFYGCNSLRDLELPEQLATIGKGAFYGCHSLARLNVPETLISIGGDAFYQCEGLKEIHIKNLSAWCAIDFYSKSANPLHIKGGDLYLSGQKVEHLIIPEGVSEISAHAFSGCSSLTSVSLPKDLTAVGAGAFNACTAITDVYFAATKEEVKSIETGSGNEPLTEAALHYADSQEN